MRAVMLKDPLVEKRMAAETRMADERMLVPTPLRPLYPPSNPSHSSHSSLPPSLGFSPQEMAAGGRACHGVSQDGIRESGWHVTRPR